MQPNLSFFSLISVINGFQMLAFVLILATISCQKEDEGPSVNDTEFCLVEINGTFEDVDLDEPPAYLDGGHDGFVLAILQELKYPAFARENDIQGTCIVHYDITQQGTVENIIVVEAPGGGIGEETVETLETVTAGVSFSPGILNGTAVRVRKELEVLFKLQ